MTTDEEIETLRTRLTNLRREPKWRSLGTASVLLLKEVRSETFDEQRVLKAAWLVHDLYKRLMKSGSPR